MNHEHLLRALDAASAAPRLADVDRPAPRRQIDAADYVLVDRLPPLAVLEGQAAQAAKRSFSQAVIAASVATALDDDDGAVGEGKKTPVHSPPLLSSAIAPVQRKQSATSARPPRKVAFWELLRAIEKRDVQLIIEVRQHDFELLTRKEGGVTPLLHCLRLGKQYNDVAVVLTGAFSKWVNQLDDADAPPTRHTKLLATAVRANLKLAINASLQVNNTDLLSSYLSVIVASSGDKWLRETVQSVAIAIRAGPAARPVATAASAIRTFATAELRSLTLPGGAVMAGVADYLANASADLVMMAAWSNVPFARDELPLFYFARDDRVYRAFTERLDAVDKTADFRKLPKLLRQQLASLRGTLEPRAINYREKVAQLEKLLDQ